MKLVITTIAVTLFLLLAVVGCGGTGGGGGGGSSEEETTSSAATTSSSEGTSAAAPTNAAATVILAPMNGSSTTGTASFTDTADGVNVDLRMVDLPAPNGTYLTHIHSGTCADELAGGEEEDQQQGSDQEHEHTGAEEGTNGEIEYPLPPITADPQGRGSTTSVLTGLTVQGLFSGGPRYINVHAEGSGNPPAIACGQLGGTG